MSKEMDKYRDDYIRESKEHIDGLNIALLTLEKAPGHKDSVGHLFRHAHTLKSMSAAMEFYSIEALCHALEDIFEKIKKQEIESQNCIDLLFKSCDIISKSLVCIEEGKKELNTEKIINSLQLAMKSGGKQGQGNIDKSDIEFHKIEKVRSINVKVDRLDRLMNLSEEFLTNYMQLDTHQKKLKDRELTRLIENLDRLVNELQYLVIQTRLVPLEYIFNRFPRMVRDLAKSENKKIDLQMQGGAVELDREIIDELGECLVHLLRNSIDHGIESKEGRLKSKKFALATITINAYRQKNRVIIEVSDDGIGLPIEAIRKKAVSMHLISPNANEEQVINTIFSGLSTSKSVTKVSGRGFGLNIVKSKIESLGGRIEVKTQPEKGMVFLMELPLTLAIIRVLFVEVNKQQYAIPVNYIVRLVKLSASRVRQLMKTEAVVIKEQEIPVIRLNRLFNEPDNEEAKIPIVIVQHKEYVLGIIVDKFRGMQDVVIKPMNTVVRQNRYFSGSTVTGNGTVVLILDVSSISSTHIETTQDAVRE